MSENAQEDVVPLSFQGYLKVQDVSYTDERNGRGVFAVKFMPKGSLVETAHCIFCPKSEYQNHLKHTVFEHYLFVVPGSGDMLCPLGLGSLFNHHDPPNIDYRIDKERKLIRYYACKDIHPGEELFIFYGGNLWFEDALKS